MARGRSKALQSLRRPAMTRMERVMAAVHGDEVDRVPVAFWHHFRPEGSGLRLAEATLGFFDVEFDLDIAKVMPDIPYPFPRRSIREAEGWRLFEPLDSRSRFLTERVECVRALRDALGNEMPIVVTVYNPLAEAMYAAADRESFLAHLATNPVLVHHALSVIAENLRDHVADVIDAGADGVFFSLQGITSAVLTESQYREFGRPYDLLALQGATNGWLNILHVHGDRDLHFSLALDYPVDVLSWSDRLAGPSLREARMVTSKCLMGGWNERGALVNGDQAAMRSEAEDAIAQTNGRRFILANGCSVPDDISHEHLAMAREIAEELRPVG